MFRFRLLAPAILFDPDSPENQAQQTAGQAAPEAQAPAGQQQQAAGAAQPGPFDENFDPTTLPEELRPGWQQLRADYTRKTQSIAEQRREAEGLQTLFEALQDPQTRPLALQALGVTETPPNDELDPDNLLEDPLEARVDAIEHERQQNAAQAQQLEYQQAIDDHVDGELDALEQRTGREFSDKELDALEAIARHNLDEQGLPDVGAAFTLLFEDVLEGQRKAWLGSKDADPPPEGQPGSPTFDTSTTEGRVQHMAAIAQRAMDRANNT